ncbi:hypothetical protein [Lacihabitans sp. LS3-19]|uniref:hypothetical protein n=1 Tax=Lacihabitans sp. LS3-19 TaxID=2487335 RepID=UPI0020CB889C|nr:hypothetical protein [Lacihabitans sp. LS3-19]
MKDFEYLVKRFNKCSLPKEQWTHEAHLVVAIWYCKNYALEKALNLLRFQIKFYNTSVGTPNSHTRGYHETLTRFWLLIAAMFVKSYSGKSFEETADAILASPFANRGLALDYYSQEVLFSLKARKSWVEPDLQKLPLDNETCFPLEAHFILSDEEFSTQFASKILNPEIFTHEAHLRLAWILIKNHGLEKGTELICSQILAFVIPLGAEEKFNTTLTVASMKMVNHFIQKVESDDFLDFIQTFPALKYEFKNLVSKHYSFDILKEERTKKAFVEPDLLEF